MDVRGPRTRGQVRKHPGPAHRLLVKLCALDAASVLAKADAICEPSTRPSQKIKEGTAKDDRAWDLARSALRAVLAVKEYPGRLPTTVCRRRKARARTSAGELAAFQGGHRRPGARVRTSRYAAPARRVRGPARAAQRSGGELSRGVRVAGKSGSGASTWDGTCSSR